MGAGEAAGLDEVVWLDGRLVARADAVVSAFDHGLTVGDGVFETLKVTDGRPFALTRHLARLRRSLAGLGLALDRGDHELAGAVDALLEATDATRARLRITVTGGDAPLGSGRGGGRPTVVVALGALAEVPATTEVVTVPWRRNEHSAVTGLKTTSYAENVVALARAAQAGASEALLANTAGHLCEGTGSNVFVAVGGRLLTPPLPSGCLAGITRELVLEVVPEAEEADLPMDVLERADEVLLTSSTRDVQAVRCVDGRPLAGAPGPWAREALARFAGLAAVDHDP
jgi:branched-chain amino acid aminotransferase